MRDRWIPIRLTPYPDPKLSPCFGCAYWRSAGRQGNRTRNLFCCHYCVDTGNTRTKRQNDGTVFIPPVGKEECPYFLKEEDPHRVYIDPLRKWRGEKRNDVSRNDPGS